MTAEDPVESADGTSTNGNDQAIQVAGNWQPSTTLDYESLRAQREEYMNKLAANDFGIEDENPQIEENLFGHRSNGAGDALDALDLEADVIGADIVPIKEFEHSTLHPVVLENIAKCGYTKPTVIQSYCIPAITSGMDVVAVSQTGSGKTAAYLAPIISALMGKVDQIGGPRVDTRTDGYDPKINKVRAEPLVLIVVPTRELAMQIFEEARRLAYRSKLRPVCAYGGIPERHNIQQLGKGCDILIGTPGRLTKLLDLGDVVSMRRSRFTVMDEADSILNDHEMEDAVSKILASNDSNDDDEHCYIMLSATFSKSARQMARDYLREGSIRITVGRPGSSHANVTQEIIFVDGRRKLEALESFLRDMDEDLVLVFCNSKISVDKVDDYLHNKDLPTAFLHGDRSQFEREDVLRNFFRRSPPILVTTAVLARGIDFTDVAVVVNYDLPSTQYGGIDEYVHRIGRTARIGHTGRSVSFYNERNEDIAPDLVNVLLETGQPVPDFLESYKPEGGLAVFHDESDDEEEADQDVSNNEEDGEQELGAAVDAGAWGVDDSAQKSVAVAVAAW